MIDFAIRFLNSYGYDTPKDFFFSMCPSFKYSLNWASVIISAVLGAFSEWIGVGPALAVAMLVTVIIEMLSGTKASRKRGEKIESFRFSRCFLKLSIWLGILYIIHSFYKECHGEDNLVAQLSSVFFLIVKFSVMIGFCIEHLISILENLAVIDGKPKEYLVSKLEDYWDTVTNNFKSKMK